MDSKISHRRKAKVLLSAMAVCFLVSGLVSAQTGMLGNDTSGLIGITKDLVAYIPILVDLVVAIVPLIFIFIIVGWLTGLFDGILDMMKLSTLKRSRQ